MSPPAFFYPSLVVIYLPRMPKLLLILLQRPSIFTASQLDKLADVFINIGTLFFGAAAVSQIVPGLDKLPPDVVFFGLTASLIPWGLALWLARRIWLWSSTKRPSGCYFFIPPDFWSWLGFSFSPCLLSTKAPSNSKKRSRLCPNCFWPNLGWDPCLDFVSIYLRRGSRRF